MDYFIVRDETYNTKEESEELDCVLNKILDDHSIDYMEVNKQETIDLITKDVLKLLKK